MRLAVAGLAAGVALAAAPAAWMATRPPEEAGVAPELVEEAPSPAPERHGAPAAGRERLDLVRGQRLLFEVRSGRLEDNRPARRPAPRRLGIPALGLRAGVVPVGVERQTGALELPENATRVGWYRFGPLPGEPGTAVIAAHVDWGERPAAFFELRRLRLGQRVVVHLADGGTSVFEVTAKKRYGKDGLPPRLWTRTGPPLLALVTCAGAFDERTRAYEDNLVVWARPV
jgi:hypothetical protein